MIDAPGLFSAIPMSAYLADPCIVPSLNSSTAVTLKQHSPLHAWARHPRNPKPIPREDNKETSIGSVAHALLLEGSEDSVFVCDPQDYPSEKTGSTPKGWTNKAIQTAKAKAIDDGLTPLLLSEMETCRSMRDAALAYIASLKKNPRGRLIAEAFEQGESEITAVAEEGPTWLRCRPDWMSNDRSVVVHLKTTARSARPETFIRGLLPSMSYDFTLAFYARVIASAAGIVPTTHCILAQEQDPPYACSLIGLNPEYTELMDALVENAVRTWAQCMKSGKWPGYPTEICYAEPRPWQIAEAEGDVFRSLKDMDPVQAVAGLEM